MSVLSLGRSLYWRCYQDYLMPSRLPEYDRLLARAVSRGYSIISVQQWADLLAQAQEPQAREQLFKRRLLFTRHDVDTDPEFTLQWSQVEMNHGAGASYFYRRSTMSPKVVSEVMRRGFHVSYHFEEVADVAKRHGLRDQTAVKAHMAEIQDLFAANLRKGRERFGWDTRIVCSHGDWINRRLGINNLALLADPEFRRQVGVEHETYDAALMKPLAGYYTDAFPPNWWRKSGDPLTAIEAGLTPIGMLTHPRQWRPSVRCNTVETTRRVVEGFAHRFSS